jgi:hypothetical protein
MKGRFSVEKIISGGQTGVDRAALGAAIELGIQRGGWCPKGRKAEDGVIPDHYPLQETSSASYPVRTEKNVKDSDGTLIPTIEPVTGEIALTPKVAQKLRKPHLVIDLSKEPDPNAVRKWGQEYSIKVLNVAGPRESKTPGIHGRTFQFLCGILN